MTKEIEIPEGYEARIDGNKVIFVPKESEDERIIRSLLKFFQSNRYETIFGVTTKDIISYLEKQKEQSITANDLDEEIHRFFDDCIDVHEAKLYGNINERVIPVDCYELTARHFAKWEEKQKEQKPAEWSEEDKNCLSFLIECFEGCSNGEKLVFTKSTALKYVEWLKSLRPQPHWKPSEYTLSLVKKVANGEMLTHIEQMAMETLCNDLQKLL